MSVARDELVVFAGEYALGLLTGDEAQAVQELIDADPDFRSLQIMWTEDLAQLMTDAAPKPPPPHVWGQLEASLFPGSQKSIMDRLGVVPAMLGGLAAAILVLLATERLDLINGLFGG